MAYSNFLTVDGRVGYSRPYPDIVLSDSAFRDVLFVISHLRVFYTKLLYLIEESDLKDSHGNWLRAANDVAIFMPIMEMSRGHIQYIREVNYYYNSKTNYNNHKDKTKEQK